MGHMIGAPLPSFLLGHENALNFALIQLVLTVPIVIAGYKFYTVGFRTLFKLLLIWISYSIRNWSSNCLWSVCHL